MSISIHIKKIAMNNKKVSIFGLHDPKGINYIDNIELINMDQIKNFYDIMKSKNKGFNIFINFSTTYSNEVITIKNNFSTLGAAVHSINNAIRLINNCKKTNKEF